MMEQALDNEMMFHPQGGDEPSMVNSSGVPATSWRQNIAKINDFYATAIMFLSITTNTGEYFVATIFSVNFNNFVTKTYLWIQILSNDNIINNDMKYYLVIIITLDAWLVKQFTCDE